MNILFFIVYLLQSNFYNIQVEKIDGGTLSMSQYQGKYILLVNIASGSSRVGQLTGLQQLHAMHGDSLVVIGLPSNSSGHESRTNAEIKQFCESNYGCAFLIAAKDPVAGPQVQPIYSWLTNISENGVVNNPMGGDFQKFLIDKNGHLIGIYGPSIEPMGEEIIGTIKNQ